MKHSFALATRSPHKAAEIREILRTNSSIRLLSLEQLGIQESSTESTIEDAESFVDNAVAKASYFAKLTGMPTLADDSGLEVAALGKAPGVRTRRFAIDNGYTGPGGEALDVANNALLLERMADVPDARRQARYVCAAALAEPGGRINTAIGTCTGMIALEPRGQGGFGYDPLFLIPELGITFAELSAEEKNERSHRARAFRGLAPRLLTRKAFGR